MSNLRIICSIIAAGTFLVLACGLTMEQKEFIGVLKHTNEQEILFITKEGDIEIDLFFLYDEEADLAIDDFDEVLVRGHYIEWFNLLSVEEIEEALPFPLMCSVEK